MEIELITLGVQPVGIMSLKDGFKVCNPKSLSATTFAPPRPGFSQPPGWQRNLRSRQGSNFLYQWVRRATWHQVVWNRAVRR